MADEKLRAAVGWHQKLPPEEEKHFRQGVRTLIVMGYDPLPLAYDGLSLCALGSTPEDELIRMLTEGTTYER